MGRVMKQFCTENSRRTILAISLAMTTVFSIPMDATAHGAKNDDRPQAAPCRSWSNPDLKPRLAVLCIHGLGLQSGSFESFAKEAVGTGLGIAVYAIDVRGFGAWMNAQGRQKVNFDECLEDVKQTLESIRAANPGVPLYLLGESMGGAIALRAASMYPDLIDGLISSVPAEERFKQGKTNLKVFMHILGGGANKEFNIGESIVDQATKNEGLKEEWKSDPLARFKLSPKELVQFQEFMNDNHEAAKKVVDMPVLIVQGTNDKLVKPEGTWELFNAVACDDKVFFAVPGEHLIFEEAQSQDPKRRLQNMALIAAWLNSKVGLRQRFAGGPGRPSAGGPFRKTGGRFGDQIGRPLAGGMPPDPEQSAALGSGGGAPGQFGSGKFDAMILAKSPDLQGSLDMIHSGAYSQAIAELERVRIQRPNDAAATGLLGIAYYKSGDRQKGNRYILNALRMGRGDPLSTAANDVFLQLVQSSPDTVSTAPSSGDGQSTGFGGDAQQMGVGGPGQFDGGRMGRQRQLRKLGRMGSRKGFNQGTANQGTADGGRPKMYAFYADWAEQCQSLKNDLQGLPAVLGSKVEIVKVNIEDPNAQALIDQYKIGPIPTVVFVAADGSVSSTIIGASSLDNYTAAANKLTGRAGFGKFKPFSRGGVQ
jgi:Lysophospholipase